MTFTGFKKGDEVKWVDPNSFIGFTIYGVVKRVNKKSARIVTCEGEKTVSLDGLNYD